MRTKSTNGPRHKARTVGTMFGRWEVIGPAEPYYVAGHSYERLMCRCSCEKHTIRSVRIDHLLLGTTNSCGCLRSEHLSDAIKNNRPWEYINQPKQLVYDDMGDYYIGHTSKGEVFYIDKEDYPLIKDTCWSVHKNSGRLFGKYNRKTTLITDVLLKAHRGYAWTFMNGNKLDYRRDNFIIEKIPSGIYFNKKSGKWHVRLTVNGHRETVGYYVSVRDAVKALNIVKEGNDDEST